MLFIFYFDVLKIEELKMINEVSKCEENKKLFYFLMITCLNHFEIINGKKRSSFFSVPQHTCYSFLIRYSHLFQQFSNPKREN